MDSLRPSKTAPDDETYDEKEEFIKALDPILRFASQGAQRGTESKARLKLVDLKAQTQFIFSKL